MSKPWDNEPTQIVDDIEDHNELTGCNGFILSDDARNIERRMRAAERLLVQAIFFTPYGCETETAINAHLEAAKKEDER